MMRTNEIVTENLKRWMNASENLKTQPALARASKVGQSHISRILRGEANPTVSILESIARAFRRNPIDLLVAPDAMYSTAPPTNPHVAQEPPPDEREILQAYRDASPEGQGIMRAVARSVTKKQQS